jgi:hypothetical protein
VTVDEHLETTQPGIYAVGDIVGQLQFTHVADYHARVVIRNTLVPFRFLRRETRLFGGAMVHLSRSRGRDGRSDGDRGKKEGDPNTT